MNSEFALVRFHSACIWGNIFEVIRYLRFSRQWRFRSLSLGL